MDAKVARCLLVSKVLVADGIMTEDERGFLDAVMTAEGLDPDERRRVIELDGWDEAAQLVRGLPIEQRRALVDQLVDAAAADGRLSAHELATIQQLSAQLGITG
jgi:uncharacterized tellurite resistance protein B-like protein